MLSKDLAHESFPARVWGCETRAQPLYVGCLPRTVILMLLPVNILSDIRFLVKLRARLSRLMDVVELNRDSNAKGHTELTSDAFDA